MSVRNTDQRSTIKSETMENAFGQQAVAFRVKTGAHDTRMDRAFVKQEEEEDVKLSDVSFATDEDLAKSTSTGPANGIKPPSGNKRSIIEWAKRLIERVGPESSLEAQQLHIAISKNEEKRNARKERRRQRWLEKRQETATTRAKSRERGVHVLMAKV